MRKNKPRSRRPAPRRKVNGRAVRLTPEQAALRAQLVKLEAASALDLGGAAGEIVDALRALAARRYLYSRLCGKGRVRK